MAFHSYQDSALPAPDPELRFRYDNPDPADNRPYAFKRFELLKPFSYTPNPQWQAEKPQYRRSTYDVPAHPTPYATSTDLASIPPFLWSLLAPYGRQLRSALLHDHLCDEVNFGVVQAKANNAGKLTSTDRKTLSGQREAADDLFGYSLRNPGTAVMDGADPRMPRFRARLFWTGVTLGRLGKFHRLRLGLVLVHLAAVTGGLLFTCCPGLRPTSLAQKVWPGNDDLVTTGSWWIGVTGLTLLLTVCWGRLGPAVLTASLVAWFVIPVALANLLANALLGIPDLALSARNLWDHSSEPSPIFVPTNLP